MFSFNNLFLGSTTLLAKITHSRAIFLDGIKHCSTTSIDSTSLNSKGWQYAQNAVLFVITGFVSLCFPYINKKTISYILARGLWRVGMYLFVTLPLSV